MPSSHLCVTAVLRKLLVCPTTSSCKLWLVFSPMGSVQCCLGDCSLPNSWWSGMQFYRCRSSPHPCDCAYQSPSVINLSQLGSPSFWTCLSTQASKTWLQWQLSFQHLLIQWVMRKLAQSSVFDNASNGDEKHLLCQFSHLLFMRSKIFNVCPHLSELQTWQRTKEHVWNFMMMQFTHVECPNTAKQSQCHSFPCFSSLEHKSFQKQSSERWGNIIGRKPAIGLNSS